MERKGNRKPATLVAISALAILVCLLFAMTPTPILLAATAPQEQQPQPLQAIGGQTTLTGQLTAQSPITVAGQSIITGNLMVVNTSSNANLTISPTLSMANATPSQFTMEAYTTEFHQGYPLGSGGQIIINGTTTSPANFTAQGTISIGAVTNATGAVTEDCLNQELRQYYTRFTTGPGGSGYIGDWNNQTNTTKIDVRAPIKVYNGYIQTYTYLIRTMMGVEAECHLFITINNTTITFYLYVNAGLVSDSDTESYTYYPRYSYVNLSQMAHDGVLPTLRLFLVVSINMNEEILNMESNENCYTSLYYIRWGENTDFESWSVSDPQSPQPTGINPMIVSDGIINATNTRMMMLTWDSAVMRFTSNSTTSSAIRVTPSVAYPGNSLRVSLRASSFTSGGWTTGGSVWVVGLQNLTQTNVRFTSYLQNLTSGLKLDLNGSQWFPASTNVTIAGGLTLNGTLDLQRTYGTNSLNLTLNGYVSMPAGYSYISPNNITMAGAAAMTAATLVLNMAGRANVSAGSMTMSTLGSTSLSLTTTGTLNMNMGAIIGDPITVSLKPPMTGSITSGSLTLTASGATNIENLNLTLTSPSTKLNATGSLSLTGGLSLEMSTDGSELSITNTGISVSSTQDNPLTVDIQGSATVGSGTMISLETSTPSATVTDGVMALTSTNTTIAANINSSGGGNIGIDAYISLTPSEAYIEISQLQASLGASTIDLTLSTDEASVSGLSSLHLETPSITVNVSNAQLNLTGLTASISLTSQQQTTVSMGGGQISIAAGTGTLNAHLQGTMEMQGDIWLSGNAEINMPDGGKITLNGQLSLSGTLSGTLELSANMEIASSKTTIVLGEGSSTLTMNGAITLTGDLTIEGGTTNIITPSGTITLTGTLQLTQANIQATATNVGLGLSVGDASTDVTLGSGSSLQASLSGSLSMTGSLIM
ncbi:MAG: hypothetical protein KIH01_07315, partial [Candidatus Freyarchaeota archaeon]|nr:hypothetical protein [Candidatus Jordarchaeia archaeon]